jgi:carbon monoxide dehydrogenase subunit G
VILRMPERREGAWEPGARSEQADENNAAEGTRGIVRSARTHPVLGGPYASCTAGFRTRNVRPGKSPVPGVNSSASVGFTMVASPCAFGTKKRTQTTGRWSQRQPSALTAARAGAGRPTTRSVGRKEAMDVEVHHRERVIAPVQIVWEEIDSLEQILAKLPQISEYDLVPGGRRAFGRSKVAWGPIKWAIEVHVAVVVVQPWRLAFTIDAPALEVHSEAAIELTPMGEAETMFDYRGYLDAQHRLASRMRGLYSELAKDQADSLVHRVKVKAEQRRLAQERLLR